MAGLTAEQKQKFLPLAPDFAIELHSASDRLRDVKDKMQEYMVSGVRLGWLIDPQSRSVFIYRPESEPVHLQNPVTIFGEPELPGFELNLTDIWEPGF